MEGINFSQETRHRSGLVPPHEQPFNMDSSSYLSARANLIAEERALRRDFQYLHTASEDELKADQIIRSIKLEESVNIWNVDHPDVPNVFPGMEFLSGGYYRATIHRWLFLRFQSPKFADEAEKIG